jgi:hypothetical protein
MLDKQIACWGFAIKCKGTIWAKIFRIIFINREVVVLYDRLMELDNLLLNTILKCGCINYQWHIDAYEKNVNKTR